MKFNRTPRLHFLFDFLQFWQIGAPSSHFRCLSRHVKHPVRTRLGLAAAEDVTSAATCVSLLADAGSGLFCSVFGEDLVEFSLGILEPLAAASATVYGGVRSGGRFLEGDALVGELL